jgi:ATP-dependent Clp protease protease subunit
MNEKHFSLDDHLEYTLLQQRKIFLSQAVMPESTTEIIRKLWYLDAQDAKKPILFIINSPGGSVDAGMAVWDQVKMLQAPVYTLVTGMAASMGSILSLCAEKGRRFATANARIMIHQPSIHGVIQGQATDLEIQAREIIKTRNRLINIYMDATGKSFDEIEKALDRDTWMTVEEALGFGLLDRVVHSNQDLQASMS